MSDRRAIERRLDSYKQQHIRACSRFDPGFGIEKKSLAVAGKFFSLDPNIPVMRDMLLYILADVLFGSRKRGRPNGTSVAWDFERYFRLAQLYYLKKRDNPKLSRTEIAKLICEHKEFKNNDPEQVRQQIGRAVRELAEHTQRCLEANKRTMRRRSNSV